MSADIFLPFKLCGCNHFVSSLSCIPGLILPKMIMIGLEKIKLEHFFRLTTKKLLVQPDLEKLINEPWVQMILSRCGGAALSFSLKCVFFLLSSTSHWRSLYISMTMPQECEDGLGTFCEHLSKIMCSEQQECRLFLFFVSESGPLTVQYPLTTSREHYSNNREEKLAVSAASYRQTWPAVLVGTHPGHRSTDLGPVSARMWPVFPLLPEMCVFLWDNHSSPVNNLKHLHCCCFILFFFYKKRWTHDDTPKIKAFMKFMSKMKKKTSHCTFHLYVFPL